MAEKIARCQILDGTKIALHLLGALLPIRRQSSGQTCGLGHRAQLPSEDRLCHVSGFQCFSFYTHKHAQRQDSGRAFDTYSKWLPFTLRMRLTARLLQDQVVGRQMDCGLVTQPGQAESFPRDCPGCGWRGGVSSVLGAEPGDVAGEAAGGQLLHMSEKGIYREQLPRSLRLTSQPSAISYHRLQHLSNKSRFCSEQTKAHRPRLQGREGQY